MSLCRIKRSIRERGAILVLSAAGSVAMLAGAALAVDVGHFFVVRNELQNAVDAAALAGAQGLILEPGNFSPSGRAMVLATEFAARNNAEGAPVQLQPSEITFPKGVVIKVEITRPARTFFAAVVGITQANITVRSAGAVASIAGGTGKGLWRPWAPMDQFGHGTLCVAPNDADVKMPPHGDFKTTPHTWMGVTVASDHYKSPFDPSMSGMDLSKESDCGYVTGFITPRDVMLNGQTISLKVNSWLTPGNFGPIDLWGSGADSYGEYIVNGYNGELQWGDIIDTETGNMVGPTGSSVNQLVAKDPSAHLEKQNGIWVVKSDAYPVNESPRIVPIPLYSPLEPPGNGKAWFPVRNFGAFFVHSAPNGKEIKGTFMQLFMHNARPDKVLTSGSGAIGAGGQLLATVTLVDPSKY
ncbi:MAG: hypothetical protein HY650_12780 [Acidobacteria bacterium]|nr:hypothetical protein [Acidobacteriota bacterium]